MTIVNITNARFLAVFGIWRGSRWFIEPGRASQIVAIVCAVAVSATAAAASPLYPPAEYDHPYAGRIILRQVHPRDVPAACKPYASPRQSVRGLTGCSIVLEPGVCLIIMLDRPTADERDVAGVRRHEEAHCNGWRHE